MSKQQKLHDKGTELVLKLEGIIDQLKELGPCPLDGSNALLNLRERIRGLDGRFPSTMR